MLFFIGLNVPPEAVITRWGTWIISASYYAKNIEKVKNYISKLKVTAQKILKVKSLILNPIFLDQLLKVKSFSLLPEFIVKLEQQSLPKVEQVEIINEVLLNLNGKPKEKLLKSLG